MSDFSTFKSSFENLKIPDVIKEIQKRIPGITQEQIAKEIGYSRTHLVDRKNNATANREEDRKKENIKILLIYKFLIGQTDEKPGLLEELKLRDYTIELQKRIIDDLDGKLASLKNTLNPKPKGHLVHK